jgi:hypothetical protein
VPTDPIVQAVFDENVRRLQQLGIGDEKYARAFLLGVKCAVLLHSRSLGLNEATTAQRIVTEQKHAVAEAERLRNLSRPLHPDTA